MLSFVSYLRRNSLSFSHSARINRSWLCLYAGCHSAFTHLRLIAKCWWVISAWKWKRMIWAVSPMPALSNCKQKLAIISFLSEIRADELWVFSEHADGWKASSNDRWLWVIIKISWISHHQNHPLFQMLWGVSYRKITHFGGCALAHISAILAEIWIKTSITASITAISERPLWLCRVSCPF